MGFPCELKASGELYDNISYLLELGGVCQEILILLYFWGYFLRKIGWFKILEVGKWFPGFGWGALLEYILYMKEFNVLQNLHILAMPKDLNKTRIRNIILNNFGFRFLGVMRGCSTWYLFRQTSRNMKFGGPGFCFDHHHKM
jgi:hypothetical protein